MITIEWIDSSVDLYPLNKYSKSFFIIYHLNIKQNKYKV